MKENTKITILISSVALMIVLILGGTLAYWQWATSSAQNTLVNVSLTDDANIIIDFPSEEITYMYPTSDCEANGTSSWVTDITVNNNTGVLLATNFKLKVKIEDKNGNIITNATNQWNANPLRYYIKYAVTEVNESCQNALITGRFDNNVLTYGNVASSDPHYSERTHWYDSKTITKDGADGFPVVSSRINSGVAFYANPNAVTSHRYKVWVWLDKDYTSVTVGNDSSMDKMQDAKITVSWSENSSLEQVRTDATPVGEAIAIYSADDESLRFYRDSNPSSITVGSTYNGRTVTEVYTEFENVQSPNPNNIPWQNNSYSEKTIVFEDYIYPVSTSYWFAYSGIELLDLTKLDMSNVKSVLLMFQNFNGSIIGLENLDTSNVTNMASMFDGIEVSILNLSGWNTSRVTDMGDMFNHFNGVIVGLENLDTSNVTHMGDMFSNVNWSGETLDLSNWDTSKVVSFLSMFQRFNGNISGLENWDTSNVMDMYGMFSDAVFGEQTSLDLSGWNVCKVGANQYIDFAKNNPSIVVPYFEDPTRCNGGLPA